MSSVKLNFLEPLPPGATLDDLMAMCLDGSDTLVLPKLFAQARHPTEKVLHKGSPSVDWYVRIRHVRAAMNDIEVRLGRLHEALQARDKD